MTHNLPPQRVAIPWKQWKRGGICLLSAKRSPLEVRNKHHNQKRLHRTNRCEMHFSSRKTPLQQPVAAILSPRQASRSPLRRPQGRIPTPCQKLQRRPLTPDGGQGEHGLGLFLTTDSWFPGNTPSPRKRQSCILMEGVQMGHPDKTVPAVTNLRAQTAPAVAP